MMSIQSLGVRILVSLFLLFAVGCGVSKEGLTRSGVYPKMYTESPVSIMIMPPINRTNHVVAKEYFFSSIATPLIDRGYYVFSPYLTLDLLEQEGAADAEPFLEHPLRPFLGVLNTDAVLFTIIHNWEKSVLASSIRVKVEYILRSARTDEILFQRTADVTVDTSVSFGGGLFDFVANAIATTTANRLIAARKANRYLLKDLPDGKYAPLHGKDNQISVSEPNLVNTTVR